MLATGGLLICIGLLTFALLVPLFRSSDPPPWTTRGWIGEAVTIGLVSTLAVGAACLIAGAIGALDGGPDPLDLGLLALVVVVAVVVGRGLRARSRPKRIPPVPAATRQAPDGAA